MINHLLNNKMMMMTTIVMMTIFLAKGLFAQNNESDGVRFKTEKIQVQIDSKTKHDVHAGDFRYDISEGTMIVDTLNGVITIEDMFVPCNAVIEYIPTVGRNPFAMKIIITGISACSGKKIENEKLIE